jgi:hypothetical protein
MEKNTIVSGAQAATSRGDDPPYPPAEGGGSCGFLGKPRTFGILSSLNLIPNGRGLLTHPHDPPP